MDANNGHSSSKSIEKVLSRKVMQAGSSAPCKIWVTGFLCGICVVYLFSVALPPLRVLQSQSVYPLPRRAIQWNFTLTGHDWERLPGFGIGAQLAGMAGLLAIAIKERRILVTNYYNRADHNGCNGASRSSWSCYFFVETSSDCRKRAFELMQSKASWAEGPVKVKENYTSKQIWLGSIPRMWGEPWKYLQPTTEINGILITNHRKMDRRWWIAQATRYLMRFPTEYMCGLLNVARHSAFGLEAAKLVLKSIQNDSPKVGTTTTKSDIQRLVWSNHRPYIPRPLLSMHVRMGDKACEMAVVGFEEYMKLAGNLRKQFPSLKNIWLSTEMQASQFAHPA
nr:unnamed protein product [Digitaria exilis]